MNLQLKQVVAAYVIAALVVNPAMAQQNSAALVRQQQMRAVIEKLSVDRKLSAAQALELVGSSHDADPALKEAMNGTTVVDIAAPSSKGVSKNDWNEFNVDENGIIFNNSAAPVLTELGGWTDGNRRLAGGEASIILNQVNGANRSTLLGQIEIAGKSAEFILANPNGITCNGCGFINTPNVSLITGHSRFENNGDLTFDIASGDVLIDGAGLNASNIDRFDIVSRYAQINANLYAQDVNIVNGLNNFNYNTKNISTNTSSNNGTIQYAFDTTALGGMYANTIRLIGTEKGLGVNLQGLVQSTQDLSITADGNLQLKQVQANNKITLESTSGNVNTESLIYAPDISIKAAQGLTNTGFFAAKNTITLDVNQLNQNGNFYAGLDENNEFNSDGQLNLVAHQSMNNSGNFYIGGQLTLTAPTLDNSGTWVMQSADTLTVDQIINHNAMHFNTQDVNLTAANVINDGEILHLGDGLFKSNLSGDLNNTGTFGTNGDLQLNANALNNQGQLFANTTQLTLNSLNNNDGQLESNGLTLNADNLSNSNGRILALGNTATSVLTANNIDNNQGVVYIDSGNFSLNANNLNNTSGNFIINNTQLATLQINNQLNNQKGFFQVNQLTINGNALDNTEGQLLTSTLNGHFGSINNTQGFIQADQLTLAGQSLNNFNGVILSNGDTASTLHLSFSDQIANNSDAVIRNINGNISIDTNNFTNANSLVDASNNGSIDFLQTLQLNNQSGRLLAKNTIQFSNDSINNIDGYIEANQMQFSLTGNVDNTRGLIQGGINLNANDLINTQGYVLLTNTSSFTFTGDLHNQQGVIATLDDTHVDNVNLSANNIDNQGELVFDADQLTITATGKIDNTGLIQNSHAINLQATDLLNNNGSISATQLDLILSNQLINNNQGQLTADLLTIHSANLVNESLALIYADQLTVDSSVIDNQSQLVSDQMILRGDQFNNSGNLLSATQNSDSLVLNFLTSVTNSGKISRNSDWSVTTGDFKNFGRIESLGYGSVVANNVVNTDINKQNQHTNSADINLNLDQGLMSAGNLSIVTSNVNNEYGVLLSGDAPPPSLPLHKGEELDSSSLIVARDASGLIVNNENGFIQVASNDWSLDKAQLNNRSGSIWHLGLGEFNANLVSDLDNTNGSIISDGNLHLVLNDINSNLINAAGLIAANDSTISVNNKIDNLNGGSITGANLDLTADTINNDAGIIEANSTDSAILNLTANQINNINGGEIRSAAKDWNLSLTNLNNDGGIINHQGSGQLTLTTLGLLTNKGDLHSNNNLIVDVGSLENFGRLSANNQLSLNTKNGITNYSTGEISAAQQFTLVAENQTIKNDGYWFFGKQLNASSSLVGSDFNNNGEWILGDGGSDSFNLSMNTLTNNGWVSYNNNGSLSINANHINNSYIMLSENGRLILNTDKVSGDINNTGVMQAQAVDITGNQFTNTNTLRVLAANENSFLDLNHFLNDQGLVAISNKNFTLQSNIIQNNGRIESTADLQLIANIVTNTDKSSPDIHDLQNNNGVIIADKLNIKADQIHNQFGMISSQSQADNTLQLITNTQASLIVDNSQGFVQSSADNWQLDNLQLINTQGAWLHLGKGNADWNMLGDLNNDLGTLKSAGDLSITLAEIGAGIKTNLNNTGGFINADNIQITTTGNINNLRDNNLTADTSDDIAGSIVAGSVILNADTINNDGGIIDANATELAELQLNATTVNNINDGELRSAANDWSMTLDSINNQGGKILHFGTGSLTLTASGQFQNDGVLFSKNNLILDLGSLINVNQISANNLTMNINSTDSNSFNLINQTSGSIYATNSTTLNAQNQKINNQGQWYFGKSAIVTANDGVFTNSGNMIIGDEAQPTTDNTSFTLGSFNNSGTVSYNNTYDSNNNTGSFIFNVNKITNNNLILANTGAININLLGAADNNNGFNNSGLILSNAFQLSASTSDFSANNSGRLQANNIDFTNTNLTNDAFGMIYGAGEDAEFTLLNSQITNNGQWINEATDWTLNNIAGSGQFFHTGTGTLTLAFNASDKLADTTYISTQGAANISGNIVGDAITLQNDQGQDHEQRTTIYASNDLTFSGNVTNQGAVIATDKNLIVNGDLYNDANGQINAMGNLDIGKLAPVLFENHGNIQADSFSIVANQLTNAGKLMAIGESNNLLSSIKADSINNQNGVIQINNATAKITSTQNINNTDGVIAKNNDGTLTVTAATTLDNTDGLISAKDLELNAATIINPQQIPVDPNKNRNGIYAGQLQLTADTLDNASGVISINAIASSYENLITVNQLNNSNGIIQLTHYEQDSAQLDSLRLISKNSIDNNNGRISVQNLVKSTDPDEDGKFPIINTLGNNQLIIQTANLTGNDNSVITSDGKLTLNSQNESGTKTQLDTTGFLQALGDLTINAANLNNLGTMIAGNVKTDPNTNTDANIILNLDGFNLDNSNLIYARHQVSITANQIHNQTKIKPEDSVGIGADKNIDITAQGFSQIGTIQSNNVLSLNLNSDLTLQAGDSLSAPGALSITTPGDITNYGSINAFNHLLLNANNLTNESTGIIVSGVGFLNEDETDFLPSVFTIQNQLINEGSIYSAGHLNINAASVFNQHNAVLMAQYNMAINVDTLINDQSRIETVDGDLIINADSLIRNITTKPTYLAATVTTENITDNIGDRFFTTIDGIYREVTVNTEQIVTTQQHLSAVPFSIIQAGRDLYLNASPASTSTSVSPSLSASTGSIDNQYGQFFAGQDLYVYGLDLTNVPATETLTEEDIQYVIPDCITKPCAPTADQLRTIDFTDKKVIYGSFRAGRDIKGALANKIANDGLDSCNPTNDTQCQIKDPTKPSEISSEFEDALNQSLPDEFRGAFGLPQKLKSGDSVNKNLLAAEGGDQPDSGNTSTGADSDTADIENERDADPLSKKNLDDITNGNTSIGSNTDQQTSAFTGETGEQGEAAETGLLDNSDEASDALADNISGLITKAGERILKTNQWPLISFTVLPFNFNLNNLSGLYVLSQNPNSNYLIETRPEFTQYQNFLGSDYLLEHLGYDADKTIKRLGDAFFENQLIRDALIKETNSRYIGDITNDYDLMQTLMQHAVDNASLLQLTLGVELTPEQCASLTEDMMWLVKKKVGGQEVLVPQLYLTSVSPEKIAASKAAIGANGSIMLAAKNMDNNSSMYAAGNLALTADVLHNSNSIGAGNSLLLSTRGDLQQDGRLFAQGDVRLLAGGNFINNGSIDGNNVFAIAQGEVTNSANGKIHAEQNLLLQSLQENVVNQQHGTLSATNLTLDAKKNVELTDSLYARNNLTLIAGQDVLLKATKAETNINTKKVKANTVQYTATNLAAGGDIVVNAGRDIQADGSDFTADGNVSLHADRDVNLQAMANEDNYQYKAKRKKEIHNTIEHDAVNINSGGTVTIDAGQDNNLTGTTISANDDVFISADRDTNISAVVDSDYDYLYRKKKKSFGRSTTKIDETLVEGLVGGTIDAGGSVMINAKTVEDSTTGKSSIAVTNSHDVNLNGVIIRTDKGDAVIAAGNDVNVGTIETSSIDYHLRKKSGLGGITGSSKSDTHKSTEQIGSSIKSGNDTVVLAGNDANLISSNIDSVNDIQINAGLQNDEGDINLLTADNTYFDETKKSKKSLNIKITRSSLEFDKTEKNSNDNTDTIRVGNSFTATNNVSLSTTRDITLEGSTIDAGKRIDLDAGRDVNLLATQDHNVSGREHGVSRNGISSSSDKNSVSMFAGQETHKSRAETNDQVSISSALTSGDETTITAGRDILVAGSDIKSEKSISLDGKRNVTIGTSDEQYQSSNEDTKVLDGLTVTVNHNLGNTADAYKSLADSGSGGSAVNDASGAMRAVDAISNSGPSASAHLGRTTTSHKQTDTNAIAHGSTLGAKENITITAGETATIDGSQVNATHQIQIDANDINVIASENTTDSKSKDSYHKTGADLNAGGGNVSLTAGFTMSSSELKTKDITSNGSSLNAENISLIARNDINIKGSDVNATHNVLLDAAHDVNIVSTEEYTRSEFDSEYKSLNAGVNFGADGVGFTMNGSIGEEELNRTNITHRNSGINAGEKLSIISGNDTTIKGANVSGKDVDVIVGHDLTVASEQDTGDVKGHKYDASFSLTVGAGVSGSVSGGYGETSGNSAWTGNQTSLTGSNSINVNVKNHTQLDGAVMGNITTDENGNSQDGNNFNLTTKTFGFSDLKDHDKEKSSYVGVSVGFSSGGDGGGGSSDGKGGSSMSYGIDAQYSSHNKKQNTNATLGNGNITVLDDQQNGTDSLAGLNRDVTQAQVITKNKSTNIDVYMNSNTIDTLTDDSKRGQLVDRIIHPSRLVGEALQFGQIADSLDNAFDTVKNGEIKKPTDAQLATMSQAEKNTAWADYYDKKEHQGGMDSSTAKNVDNKIVDFAVATENTMFSLNHNGINFLGLGENNNLLQNYQLLQDSRTTTTNGRAYAASVAYGEKTDGVDVLNNFRANSVETNQSAMQALVNGMSGTSKYDALLYSSPSAAGLPSQSEGVAVVNSNTNIVGVNVDKTNIGSVKSYISTIAEETYHNMHPGDNQANVFAAQSARVWTNANVNEGRTTGQGVSTQQWRDDNKNNPTINLNNERIGSQRVSDMEFRGLDKKFELPLIRDTAPAFARQQHITPEQAEQQLVDRALANNDSTFADLPQNDAADEWLSSMSKAKGVIKDGNGEYTIKMLESTDAQYNSDHEAAQQQWIKVHSDHELDFDPTNANFILTAPNPDTAVESLARVVFGNAAFENNQYGHNDVVFGDQNNVDIFQPNGQWGSQSVVTQIESFFSDGIVESSDINKLDESIWRPKSLFNQPLATADMVGYLDHIGMESNQVTDQWGGLFDGPKREVFNETIRYYTNNSKTPTLLVADNVNNFEDRDDEVWDITGKHLPAQMQMSLNGSLESFEQGQILDLSDYSQTGARNSHSFNDNFLTETVNAIKPYASTPGLSTPILLLDIAEGTGRNFETTFTDFGGAPQDAYTEAAAFTVVDIVTLGASIEIKPVTRLFQTERVVVDDFRTPEVNLNSLYDAAPVGSTEQPLLLTQMERTAPDGYPMVKNPDGTFTIKGPISATYESTPYYTADGVPIYKSSSGSYYAMDEAGSVKVNSPNPTISLTERGRHHDNLVADVSDQLENQGYIVGNEVNIANIAKDGVTRTDIVYVRPDNSVAIVEIKTGNAPNTSRQKEIFPQIENGNAIITEQLARLLNSTKKFDVKAGQTLRDAGFPNGIPVYQLRGNGI